MRGIPYWRTEVHDETIKHTWASPKMAKKSVEELAKELDEKLEKHIQSLPKTEYKGGLSEDNWEEVRISL